MWSMIKIMHVLCGNNLLQQISGNIYDFYFFFNTEKTIQLFIVGC